MDNNDSEKQQFQQLGPEQSSQPQQLRMMEEVNVESVGSGDLAATTSIQQPKISGAAHVQMQDQIQDDSAGGEDGMLTTCKAKLQPFEQCRKRQLWDGMYGHLVRTDLKEEKNKIEENMKPPRKPLSPYLFFSQERRKVIKSKKPELNAKQIMRIVSKEWQEISEERDKEVYEYLSLRDRELYDVLCKHWKQIKMQAVQQGQQLGIPYEPLEGTIAHAVSRRKQINAAAAAAATPSQPNNSSLQVADAGNSDSDLNLKNSIKSYQKHSNVQKKSLRIEQQSTNQSQLGKKRGRPPKWSVTPPSARGGKKKSPKNTLQVPSQQTTIVEQASDSRLKKSKQKQITQWKERKSSDLLCSQDVTTKNNENDGFDQNEKVRRIFEDNKPTQLNDPSAQQPPSYDFSELGPASQRCRINNTIQKKTQRSQRFSADVTNQVGQGPAEQGFLMIHEEQLNKNDNQSRGVVTQSAKSELRRKRKPSNVAPSNMAQENRTSHSDDEEQNNPNQITFTLLKDLQADKKAAQKLSPDHRKPQVIKALQNSLQIKMNSTILSGDTKQYFKYSPKGAEISQYAQLQIEKANQTIQKQPNKLRDLFNNNVDADSITEVDVINYPTQNASTQRQAGNLIEGQGDSVNQIQKRPSTHKNMQTTTKIFDIDKNNSVNAVRKTEEIMVTPNPETMETNLLQNTQQNDQNAQRGQGEMPIYQTPAQPPMTSNQDVIYPFLTQELLNQIISVGDQQQPPSQAEQQAMVNNSHLLLPRLHQQNGSMGTVSQQTPHFIQSSASRLQPPSSSILNGQQSFPFGSLNQSLNQQRMQADIPPDTLDLIFGSDPLQLAQNQLHMSMQQNGGQLGNNMFNNLMPLSRHDSIQNTMARHDSIQRTTNMSNIEPSNQIGTNLTTNVNNHLILGDSHNNRGAQALQDIGQNMNTQNGLLDFISFFQNPQQNQNQINYDQEDQQPSRNNEL